VTALVAPAAAPSRIPGAGGVTLVADTWGDAGRAPIVLLHGGGQTRGAWGGAAERLAARGWRVIVPDLRGHGESDWSPDGDYSLERFADDLRALVGALDRPPVLVGASLGGIVSLVAAGEPPRVAPRGIVLVDVAHRPEPVGVSRILAFMRSRPDGFATVEEAAAAVAAYLPHRTAPDSIEGLKRNLRWKDGRWIWHWDPAVLAQFSRPGDRSAGAAKLLAAARAVTAPILLVRGALSDVLTEPIAREFCAAIPSAAYVDVADAGHMVAGDRNDRFVDALVPFLERLRPRG
jgi:pimeloyl-ACP methyl ester carboxylesterase